MKGADIARDLLFFDPLAQHIREGFLPYGSRTANIARRAQYQAS